MTQFNQNPHPLAFQRKQIAAFVKSATQKSLVLQDEVDEENIEEGWEKLVMSQLFDKVFLAAGSEEARANASLTRKMESFYWVQVFVLI